MGLKKQIDIFLVEDDRVFLLALKEDIESTFRDMNIKTHTFSVGETCMLKFSQIMPQIVILDYRLNSKYPEAANGVKVLDLIKRENPDTHTIMLTSDDHIDIALDAFHHGASDYVVKTPTKFKKINYSMSNVFRIIEAKQEAGKYKALLLILCLSFSFLVGGISAIQMFAPSLFK